MSIFNLDDKHLTLHSVAVTWSRYPSDNEKLKLAVSTGLSRRQVSAALCLETEDC
jgi:hypothetical protein